MAASSLRQGGWLWQKVIVGRKGHLKKGGTWLRDVEKGIEKGIVGQKGHQKKASLVEKGIVGQEGHREKGHQAEAPDHVTSKRASWSVIT